MVRLTFMSVAAASLMLFQGAYGEESDSGPQVTADSVCFAEMNKAREAVGYAPFLAATDNKGKLPEAPEAAAEDGFWKEVCQSIRETDTSPGSTRGIPTPSGIFAFFKQTSATPECAAAIEYFKSGFSLIGTELPPAYNAETKPYNDEKAMSFFALYNPGQSAAAECQVVTCPEEDANDYGLVCLSYPPFVNGQLPYNEKDWKKITDVFASSASVAVSSLLVLAAAAVGLALH